MAFSVRHLNCRGLDNRVYYMLAPQGQYYNFSGCGNTFNCNHPVVQVGPSRSCACSDAQCQPEAEAVLCTRRFPLHALRQACALVARKVMALCAICGPMLKAVL